MGRGKETHDEKKSLESSYQSPNRSKRQGKKKRRLGVGIKRGFVLEFLGLKRLLDSTNLYRKVYEIGENSVCRTQNLL